MAEKTSDSPYPLAPSNGHSQNDQVSASANSNDQRKRNRIKCLLYILLFAVFQIGVILVFLLMIMRAKNPKFRVQASSFVDSDFNIGTEVSPSFDLRMNTQFTVKNTNFGDFKYEVGMVTFAYRGTSVGEVTIKKGRAGIRSTKKVDVVVELRSSSLSSNTTDGELGSDISSGVLPLTSYSKLEGKIHMMKVIKRKKSARMNCTMEIDIHSRKVGNIICK
ncbi:putative ATP-binding cassette transporter [Hibiscus syriacus]|uniref:ATP-binding cassette transporter n=1 Tax=Hibiscus syriacus TaxID=106335 RepID=A0A6A3CXP5_HIBSY|nr:late embryogenesis abundant protein At1g64065-like [Hibiscus syriacus]KAE8733896.1 putative ATP-binding cassette transporter [Hibiscus syriacus]